MKKALSILLSLIMAFSAFSVMPFSAFALDSSGRCGNGVYWSFDSASGTLTLSGTGDTWDFTYDIDADPMCNSPFYENLDIKNIIVESGVTGLGNCLFDGCYNVESISLPEGLSKIGESALNFFRKMESVTLPSSVRHIGAYAFSNWHSLKSITIPDGVTSIESNAFLQCYGLKYVVIPKSVTSVGENAFMGCSSLTDVYYAGSEADKSNMTISNSGNKWFTDAAWYYESGQCGDNIYYGYTYDPDLGEPYKNLFISGTGDMYSWDNADNKSPFNGDVYIYNVTIGDGITGIGDYAFTGCTKLFRATIPKSVNEIGEGAFASSDVYEIVIPDGVETLEENVFSGCTNLTQLYIPSSVTTIKKGAFKDAPLSREVFLGASGDDWSAVTTDETDNETLLNAEKYFGIPGAFEGFKDADIRAVNYQENEIKNILVTLSNDHRDKKITLTVFNDKGETVCSEEATVTAYMSGHNISTATWTPPYLKSGEYTVFAYGILDGYKNNTEKDGKQYLYYNTESFEVTPNPVYSISNYAELKEFAALVNGGNTTLKAVLTADIVCKNNAEDTDYATDWIPIGNFTNPYTGTFDGNGHTITGLSNEDVPDEPDYAGLFGSVGANGVVKNVHLTGVILKASKSIGAVAGYSNGVIANCYNTGDIIVLKDAYNVGGIVGYLTALNYNAEIISCYNTGNVASPQSTQVNALVGGITSGLVANSGTAKISNCYNTGAVTGTNNNAKAGGIAGSSSVGTDGTVKITNCFNTGAVTATGNDTEVGGITGSFSTGNSGTAEITCCYNMGTVTAGSSGGRSARAGGITGIFSTGNSGTAEITCCYSAGAVSAKGNSSKVGGVIGYDGGGTAENCYYNWTVCTEVTAAINGVADTDNMKGLTTDQMTGTNALSNMTGFVGTDWLVKENGKDGLTGKYYKYYPHLKGFNFNTGGEQQAAEDISAADWPAKTVKIPRYKAKPLNESITYGSEAPTSVRMSYEDEVGNAVEGLPETLPCISAYSQYGDVGGYEISLDVAEIERQGIFDAGINCDISDVDLTSTSTLTVNQKQLTVSWGNNEFTYDGTQKNLSLVITGFESSDINNVNSFLQNTSKTDAGNYTAQLSISGDKAGNYCINDADKSKDWKINKADLTITANQQDYIYNGEIQGPGDATYEDAAELAEVITVSGLKGDDKVTGVIIDGQGKDIGTYELVPSGATINGNSAGNNYNVTYVNGVLRINPKTVTITAKSEEFTYDGTAHSCSLYDVEGLVGSDAISAIVEGSITFPSESPVNNVVKSYQFTSGNPNNYTVTTKNGTLTMRKASVPITITSASQEWTYDGSAHSNNGVTLTSGSLFEGDTLTATATGSVTNFADTVTGNNPIASGYKIMHGTADVTDNYVITPVNGTLTIKPAAITITAEDKESNHGLDLLALTYKIGGNYVDGDDLGITLNADIDNTKPGTYIITPAWNNNQNYTATLVDGTYTVGNSPHYYGTQGDERFTCTVCGTVDETLKAEAEKADKEAADKAAAEAKAAQEKANAEFAKSVTVTADENGATVGWQKAPKAKRYVIYATYCGKGKYKKIKTVKGNITSFKLKKLNGKKIDTKKNLKVYIVAQKKVNGKWVKLFKSPTFHIAGKKSKNTNIKKIKVKKAKYNLKVGKKAKIKAELVLVDKKKKPINHVRKFRYMSTNTAVAKVTKKGKIKAVGKGTATVYVFSNNGTPKAIKVTVK